METNNQEFRKLMTSIIYEEIFGKSRVELITESRAHWNHELVAMHAGNLDEIIRDYMTLDALRILAEAEQECAREMWIHRNGYTIQDVLAAARSAASWVRGKHGDFKLWEWE